MKTHFIAAAAALFVSAPALAAPVISGKYIVTERRLCQPVGEFDFATADPTGDYVNGVNLHGGVYNQTMLLANFSPAKGTVTINGFEDAGDPMLFALVGAQNGQLGAVMGEAPVSGKVSYSNGDTTISLGTQSYNVLYGQVDKNGIAHYFVYQGVLTNGANEQCSEQAEASRQ